MLAPFATAGADGIPAVSRVISADTLRAHMAFLADDLLEGRKLGERGYDIAAQYVASRFQESGLKPLDGSYFQKFKVRRATVDESASSLGVVRENGKEQFRYGEDFTSYGSTDDGDIQIDSTVVFVGFGVSVSGRHDDYADIDVRGRVVLAVNGVPSDFPGAEASFYGSAETKGITAARHDAAALLLIDDPNIPWSLRARAARQIGRTDWLPRKERRSAPIVYITSAAAERLAGRPLQPAAFQVGVTIANLTLRLRSIMQDLDTANVIGVLSGADRVQSADYVVLTAHLDHVGVGDPINGDRIYNGAVDNASGVAAMLAISKAFTALRKAPRRSMMFVATAAEEEGEVGSDYLVQHSPVPLSHLVAALNIDGVSIVPFSQTTAAGGVNSTLGDTASRAGDRLGIKVQRQSIGVGGSDHSPFLLSGIPVLWLQAELPDEWMRSTYHSPQDDLAQPIDFNAAVRYVQLNWLTAYIVADATKRPAWATGDFFAQPRRMH
jgi:hypothetical protein